MLILRSALFALFCATFAAPAFAAGPTIDIVLGEKADPLEKFAAEEMAGQLKKLFDAEVRIGTSLPAGSKNIVLIGTEQSNPLFKSLGLNLPAVLQHDYALKSYPHQGASVLVVVGANPQSVLWASYELGWRLGIRYFTFGDLYPTATPVFTTAGFDVMIRPAAREIAWNPTFASPLDFAPWGIDDARAYLRQLAKLRATGQSYLARARRNSAARKPACRFPSPATRWVARRLKESGCSTIPAWSKPTRRKPAPRQPRNSFSSLGPKRKSSASKWPIQRRRLKLRRAPTCSFHRTPTITKSPTADSTSMSGFHR